MITARVTSKGQITIPKEIREKLGIRVGEELGFEEENGRLVIKKAFTRSPFDKWMGKLKHLTGRSGDELVKEIRGHDNGG
jgi:antitoxin PrlF